MVENNQYRDKEQQKEVNFLDLLIVLLKHKWMILSVVLLTTVTCIIYIMISDDKKSSLKLPQAATIYYSDCTIEVFTSQLTGSLVTAENIIPIISSRTMATSIAKANKLKQIRREIWDEKENKWMTVEDRSLERVASLPILKIRGTNNVIALNLISTGDDSPQKLLSDYLQNISEYFRMRYRQIYEGQLLKYQQQLAITKDSLLKASILDAIITKKDQLARAETNPYCGFNVIDYPSAPISVAVDAPKQPKYGMIIILLALASFVIAVSLAFIIDYMNHMKIKEPEKYNLMRKYLRVNCRRR